MHTNTQSRVHSDTWTHTHTHWGWHPSIIQLKEHFAAGNWASNYSMNSLRIHEGNPCRTFSGAPRSNTHTHAYTTANHSSPKSPARLNVHLKIHTSAAPGMLWKNNEGQKSSSWGSMFSISICLLFLPNGRRREQCQQTGKERFPDNIVLFQVGRK